MMSATSDQSKRTVGILIPTWNQWELEIGLKWLYCPSFPSISLNQLPSIHWTPQVISNHCREWMLLPGTSGTCSSETVGFCLSRASVWVNHVLQSDLSIFSWAAPWSEQSILVAWCKMQGEVTALPRGLTPFYSEQMAPLWATATASSLQPSRPWEGKMSTFHALTRSQWHYSLILFLDGRFPFLLQHIHRELLIWLLAQR